MQTDATQAIRDVENSLRGFISEILHEFHGSNWTDKCGVTPERIAKWNERKDSELKRQPGGVVETRIIYYADFYDLGTILKKHWEKFSPALGDWKTTEVYLGELEKMRDAGAHGRDLLPHQKHLANGIAGEIRTRLIRYRSKKETCEDYFPRIESVRDSLGNIWASDQGLHTPCFTKHVLRPDDIIDYVVTASDPMGEALNYAMSISHKWPRTWQAENTFSYKVLEKDIGTSFCVSFHIQSPRAHHASGDEDHNVEFVYSVLPKK
jgi:Swt1-like HEPN